jgi:UPF0176 protein|tara:strand:- start:80981 stop:81970 length:990 start_codon:yes stop_codon:yes gene_type:complete
MSQIVVCALYKFVRLEHFETLRQPLLDLMLAERVRGTLLLAHEGINGTIAGTRKSVDKVLAHLQKDSALCPLDTKESFHQKMPFLRSKVKLKKEIVTMGVEGIDPNRSAGAYVAPADWNALISDPEVLLLDTRNGYEVEIGTFENAVNPNTKSFRDFPAYVKEKLNTEKHKKVAMFCTGGIRCEKSTAYLKRQGFDEVYHLQGGILKYLEEVKESDSLWQGECFVFDDRVAVNHSLIKGKYDQCHACRYPITEEEKSHRHYQQGVSCHRCFDKVTPEQRERYAEREKQIRLAQSRGEAHLGTESLEVMEKNRLQKEQDRELQRESNRGQ